MHDLAMTGGGWSYADQDYSTVNRHGVGGAAHTFKYAAGLHTNDRHLYKDNTFNNTQRYQKGQEKPEDDSQFYFYKGADNQLKKLNLMNQMEAFQAAKDLNHDGKAHYSKALDGKWSSNVKIEDRAPAGMAQKIQSKAYRANTQS